MNGRDSGRIEDKSRLLGITRRRLPDARAQSREFGSHALVNEPALHARSAATHAQLLFGWLQYDDLLGETLKDGKRRREGNERVAFVGFNQHELGQDRDVRTSRGKIGLKSRASQRVAINNPSRCLHNNTNSSKLPSSLGLASYLAEAKSFDNECVLERR